MGDLQYKLHGFEKVKLNENCGYVLDNNKFLKKIFIEDSLSTMTVELHDDVSYKENRREIEIFLNQICLNMIMKSGVSLNHPWREIEVINDNFNDESNKEVQMFDSFSIKDELICIESGFGANIFYDEIVKGETAMSCHPIFYERIFKTLFNPDLSRILCKV